jgi:hypothetical protein
MFQGTVCSDYGKTRETSHTVVELDTLIVCKTERPSFVGEGLTHSFVYGRSRDQILTRRLAILTEGFRDFHQSLKANIGISSLN